MKAKPARSQAEGVRFTIRVTPRGGRDAIEGLGRDADGAVLLKARVAAPPEDGKANAALTALLAKTFEVPKKSVTIRSGAAARVKRVERCGDRAALSSRLTALGERPGAARSCTARPLR